MRHYTIDNIKWLKRSDNIANKPLNGKETGEMDTSLKST
jgi:hypothetical protein